MRRTILAVVLLAIALVVLPGCEEDFDTYEDPTLEEIMDIGKGYLRAGDGGSAAEAFEAAIELSPTCGEAKYGLLISRNMQFISLLDELIAMIGDFMYTTGEPGQPDVNQMVQFSSEPIGDYIQDFLGESAEWWYEDCEEMYLDLLTYPDPFFEIDGFSMDLADMLTIEFGGRLDRSDLHFFGTVTAMMRALVNILLAHDLNYDFFSLEIPELSLELDFEDPDAILNLLSSLGAIIELLEDLLTYDENPDFLYLKGEEGIARMQAAGRQLGMAFFRIHLMIEEVYREPAPQADEAVRYIDANNNGQGDRRSDPMIIPAFGQLDAQLVNGLDVLCAMTATAFFDHTVLDIDPYRPNPFYISYANDLLVALDILPLVIDAELLGSLGLDLETLLEDLLASLGLDVGDINVDNFQIVIPEIPDWLPIDLGPWFAEPDPDGIRQIVWLVVDLFNTIETYLPDLL